MQRYRVSERYESWIEAVLFSIAIFIWWVDFGLILSDPFVSSLFPEGLKVLDRSDTLQYLGAVLAIQVPVFILFLQEMVSAGFVLRKVLPRVTKFKEIIVSLMTCSTLVLLSPRESYLYFPVLMLMVVNYMAIFRAVTVTFQRKQYHKQISKRLEYTAVKSFDVMMDDRRKHNKIYQSIEESKFIEISYFDKEYPDSEIIPIKAKTDGYFEHIDIKNIISILTSEFPIEQAGYQKVHSVKPEQSQSETQLPILRLRATPFYDVSLGDLLAQLVVPTGYKDQVKLSKQISKAIKINPDKVVDSEIKYLDEIMDDMTLAVKKAVKDDDIEHLVEVLAYLKSVLNKSDYSAAQQDEVHKDIYTVESAYNEFTSFINDDYSSRQRQIYELLTDVIEESLETSKIKVANELTRFIYKEILDTKNSLLPMSIARYDGVLLYIAGRFIFPNTWNSRLNAGQEAMRDSIFRRIKEISELLLYEIKKESPTNEITHEWFLNRLGRIRGLTVASIAKENEYTFHKLMSIIADSETSYQVDELEPEDSLVIKCNIFMILAYLKQSDKLNTTYGESVNGLLRNWTDEDVMSVLLECISKDYAGKWHIDTYDHPADGVVRSVPNYDDIIKELWVDIMQERNVTVHTDLYGDKSAFEQTLIFTQGLSDNGNNSLLDYAKKNTSTNGQNLVKLIEEFISIRRNYETTVLTKAKLNSDKTKQFRSKVNEAYKKSSIAFKIFKYSINYFQDKSQATKDFKQFGINQLFDKEAFIDDWHSGYIVEPMAEQVGRQIAQGQDKYIFINLIKKIEQEKDIKTLIRILKKNHRSKVWLVVSNKVRNYEIINSFKKEIRSTDFENAFFKDINQSLPIQHTHIDEIPKGIYVLDIDAIGRLDTKQDNKFPVKVLIDAYSSNKVLRDGIMKANPKWLQEKGDSTNQLKFLNTKVRMYIQNIFKYTPPKRLPKIHYISIDEVTF